MSNTNFQYNSNEFFNENEEFLFLSPFDHVFRSKVEFSKGHWWTVRGLQYKATTIKSALVEDTEVGLVKPDPKKECPYVDTHFDPMHDW